MVNALVSVLNRMLNERGWSRTELALRAGMSVSLVSEVLNGNCPATADFCVRCGNALGGQAVRFLALAGHIPAEYEELEELDPQMATICEQLEALREHAYPYFDACATLIATLAAQHVP